MKPTTGEQKDFAIKYNPKQLDVVVEKVPLTSMEDKGIKDKWGDRIYRINFNVKNPKAKDKISFIIAVR